MHDGVTYRFELIQTQVEARRDVTSTPRAPDRSISSSSGEEIAFQQLLPHGLHRSPRQNPSLLAHLRHYGAYVCKVHVHQTRRVISSAIPCTAPFSTSFAAPTHPAGRYRGPELSAVCRSGCDQRVHMLGQFSDPLLRECHRFLPSKLKGLVTTATVRIPNLLPLQRRLVLHLYRYHHPYRSNKDHVCTFQRRTQCIAILSAALRPTSGLAPAPSPLVIPYRFESSVQPLFYAALVHRYYREEFNTFNALAHHVFNSITPPPPTPMTLITASLVSSIGST